MQDVESLKFCESNKDCDLAERFKGITEPLGIHNIFNPSFYSDDKARVFSFRAIPNGSSDSAESFVSIECDDYSVVRNISVELYNEIGCVRASDPKVARIDNDLYITFNSGWYEDGKRYFHNESLSKDRTTEKDSLQKQK